ncbi:hypothetical protein BJF81_13205 [Ornithinimicrobium sp. CNJ-824]|nr:hypothetical protein BJF81_13205 [Ornithinimicrobium sp. CNJ-824]
MLALGPRLVEVGGAVGLLGGGHEQRPLQPGQLGLQLADLDQRLLVGAPPQRVEPATGLLEALGAVVAGHRVRQPFQVGPQRRHPLTHRQLLAVGTGAGPQRGGQASDMRSASGSASASAWGSPSGISSTPHSRVETHSRSPSPSRTSSHVAISRSCRWAIAW